MAIIDRVKFDGLRSRDWLIYKHPSSELVFGTQLIVNEGQAVVFVKGGEICDTFTAGTYTLETQNLPILKTFINMPFGGKTPFTAEIYYINLATKLDILWGTTDPIQLIDPKYFVKLRVRAFGQMGLKINDYVTFMVGLIGSMAAAELVNYEKIQSFFKGLLITKIKTIIAETIINHGISALELTAKLEDISEIAKDEIIPEFQKYGFDVVNFFVQSINFPDEDFDKINEILEDKAAFEIMGDNRYTTKRSFDIYEGAAKNQNGVAGAMAAGGIGLGAGLTAAVSMDKIAGNTAEDTKKAVCPECHTKVNTDSKYCNECGAVMLKKKIICPDCGAGNRAGTKFCGECGKNLQVRLCSCGTAIEPGDKFCNECGKRVD